MQGLPVAVKLLHQPLSMLGLGAGPQRAKLAPADEDDADDAQQRAQRAQHEPRKGCDTAAAAAAAGKRAVHDQAARADLAKEAFLLSRLNHPNIVKMYGVGQQVGGCTHNCWCRCVLMCASVCCCV